VIALLLGVFGLTGLTGLLAWFARPGAKMIPMVTAKRIIFPIAGGATTSAYGMRDDPLDRGHQRFHPGTDFKAATGTPVLAPEDGEITRIAPNNGGAGNMVVMQGQDGRSWTFMHLSAFYAGKGKVRQGQPIAASGATGNITGPHLHLELRVNGQRVDPMTVFTG
jgi:murein DD-endopeptidase MepM/ murein hydrolase activator NlpD